MECRRLGASNLLVSRLWLGGMSLGSPRARPWVADRDVSVSLIRRAIEHGINAIDTADAYGAGESEAVIGETIADMGVRDEVVLATKFGLAVSSKKPNQSGYSRKYIVQRCEESLRHLRTDRIDLLQTHIWRADSSVDETAEAFDALVRQGKVLYAGITDMPTWQAAKWIYTSRFRGLAPLVSLQHHYNAVWREDERGLVPLCQAEGVGLVAYSPLARGFLAGGSRGTRREETDDLIARYYSRDNDALVRAEVARAAGDTGLTPAEIALLWVLGRKQVTSAVVGPTGVGQLDALVPAAGKTMAPEIAARISAAYAPRPEAGHG